jgi:hypothetical protein
MIVYGLHTGDKYDGYHLNNLYRTYVKAEDAALEYIKLQDEQNAYARSILNEDLRDNPQSNYTEERIAKMAEDGVYHMMPWVDEKTIKWENNYGHGVMICQHEVL